MTIRGHDSCGCGNHHIDHSWWQKSPNVNKQTTETNWPLDVAQCHQSQSANITLMGVRCLCRGSPCHNPQQRAFRGRSNVQWCKQRYLPVQHKQAPEFSNQRTRVSIDWQHRLDLWSGVPILSASLQNPRPLTFAREIISNWTGKAMLLSTRTGQWPSQYSPFRYTHITGLLLIWWKVGLEFEDVWDWRGLREQRYESWNHD